MQKIITLSVHDIVDIILRTGNIDNRVFSTNTMTEGTRLHGLYQKQQDGDYYSEVALTAKFEIGEFVFLVEGRADGIIIDKDKNVTIDEIKTTVMDLEDFYEENEAWHLGQAKFYAYIYALNNKLDKINIRLTYISQSDFSDKKFFTFSYSFAELEKDIHELVNRFYLHFNSFLIHEKELKENLTKFSFPYSTFRKGQKEILDTLNEAIKNDEFAYIEAPTGIGKTAATLYPFIKAMEEKGEKIFYLTSKNSIKGIVMDTIKYFNSFGLNIKAITINSKESLCINEKVRHCNPDECPFAVGYYEKINNVVHHVFENYDCLTYQDILEIAKEFKICPFEMQLDISTYFDIIIADYNHLFHPSAHLMRFFDSGPRPYYLLVDEAHNLPSRIRDMHSGSIDYYSIYLLYKDFKPQANKFKKMHKSIKKLLDYFIELDLEKEGEIINGVCSVYEIPEELLSLLSSFMEKAKDFLADKEADITDEFLKNYYEIKSLLELPVDDDSYAYYFEISSKGKAMKFNASCLDSKQFMSPAKRIFLSGAFFSATLTPNEFYLDLLDAKKEESYQELYLDSPFPSENLRVLVDMNISIFYKDRDYTLPSLLKAILAFIKGKVGNYFVFFPSYKYMQLFTSILPESKDYNVFIQENHMTSEDRDTFLSHFELNPQKTNLGFVVLGGVFSEGIDLIEDRLIGAIIVGVGLSMITYENERLKQYYDEQNEEDINGYEYAYVYPGINRFLQAAGRVIRSETDQGMILYIDTRYRSNTYKNILLKKYKNITAVYSEKDIENEVDEFWRKD